MKPTKFLWIGVLACALFALSAGVSLADDCSALGGVIVGTECQVKSSVTKSDAAHGGPFNIAEDLRICGKPGFTVCSTGPGKISVPASNNSLTINITGQLIMED